MLELFKVLAGIITGGGLVTLFSAWSKHQAKKRADNRVEDIDARDVLWRELNVVRDECKALRAEVKELREQLGSSRDAKSVLAADHKVLLADHERLTREIVEITEDRDRWRDTAASLAAKVEAFERGESPPRRGDTGRHSAVRPTAVEKK